MFGKENIPSNDLRTSGSRDLRRTASRATTAFASLAALTWSAVAAALPPAEPIPGADFTANQAYVGDILRGMEPVDGGNLYGFWEDLPVHMASTTKSFTLLLAVEAVESGWVSLNDLVTISERAAGINTNHGGSGQNTHSNEALVAGIQIRFEDLLYSMIHTSAGDSSMAIAQHVAASMDQTLAGATDMEQEAAFTARMNNRAQELGLDDTVFFNAYGGDHEHGVNNAAGANTEHSSSARDMARWFAAGMELPLFREIAGFSGTWNFGSWNSLHTFSTSGGNSYPGYTGGKGGGGGDGVGGGCGACAIGTAERGGRELAVAYTQGNADGTVLFDYGFASVFHPTLEATSAPYTDGWQVEDLACLTPDRAISAIVDGSSQTRLLVWDVDVDGGSIDHANPITPAFEGVGGLKNQTRDTSSRESTGVTFLPEQQVYTTGTRDDGYDDYAVYVGGDDPEPTLELDYTSIDRGDGGGGFPTIDPKYSNEKGDMPVVTDVRVTDAGYGRAAVVEESDEGIKLYLYGINTEDSPFLMDWEFIGEGTRPRVTRLDLPSGYHIVVAHRRTDGFTELNVYRLVSDPVAAGHFLLSNATDSMAIVGSDSVELDYLGSTSGRFVVAARTSGGNRSVRVFSVHSATGLITSVDSWSSTTASSKVDVTRLTGFDHSNYFALGYRNANGFPTVQVYRVDGTNTIESLGATASNEWMNSLGNLRIERHRDHAVMLTYEDGDERVLEVYALDESASGGSVNPAMLTSESSSESDFQSLCRLPGNDAEGDFLVSQGEGAATALRIEAWRSGER